MQNDINFRGYVSGPLLGSAQAMAIYQNGMRVNESFGEVVQWDLIPDFAINNMQIFLVVIQYLVKMLLVELFHYK